MSVARATIRACTRKPPSISLFAYPRSAFSTREPPRYAAYRSALSGTGDPAGAGPRPGEPRPRRTRARAATEGPWTSCRVRQQGCTMVKSYSKHWPCLFPQHGPGRKHHRRIELREWQEVIVQKFSGEFAKGLFHSDGWRGVNRVRLRLC